MTMSASKSNIHVLGTGGTISGAAPSPEMLSGYKSGTFPVVELLKEVPEVSDFARVTSEQIINVGSGSINGEVLLKLAKRINKLCKEEPEIDGYVVTHGLSLIHISEPTRPY